MSHILEDLKAFFSTSPTSYHAASQIGNRLALVDFTPLDEKEKWHLEMGKRYFVQRGGTLCAFCMPTSAPKRAVILASHTDSPALKLKPKPEFRKENMTLLRVEVYGSPILQTWISRDLCIAGRIIVDNQEERLVFLDDVPVIIPSVALHLEREVNEKGMILNKQEHLNALLAIDQETPCLEMLLRRHLAFKTLLGFDLFLTPLEEGQFLGINGELFSSYRVDNLASAHACSVAIASTQPQKNLLPIALFWDHEEIGSNTAEGAASSFIEELLERILKFQEEDLMRIKRSSLCVSVDVAHALNPNYPEKHDPEHKPLLGRGIVIKYNADQRYATNAETASYVMQKCKELKINYQSFSMRSDLKCGSTVGPIMAANLGIPTVDIGIPELSMHSAREVISCPDHLDMCQLLTQICHDESL